MKTSPLVRIMILLVVGIAGKAYGIVPNDPMFDDHWNHLNLGQTGGTIDADMDTVEAWDITTGNMSTVVAIIDGGVQYYHPDLYLNIWLNQNEIPVNLNSKLVDTDNDGIITFYDLNEPVNAAHTSDINGTGYIDAGDLLEDPAWENGVDEDGNGFMDDLIGWDFNDDDNEPWSTTARGRGHGTGMAGVVGAIGDNGVGITGILWKVSIMPVRTIQTRTRPNRYDGAAALGYAVAEGATISNNSWLSEEYSQEMYDAIEAAGEQGHLFVAAAGNDGEDNDTVPMPVYPASYDLDNIISVTGTDQKDISELGRFNYGLESVDLAAPADNVPHTSTDPNDDNASIYRLAGGTSSASANVTGVAALLRTIHPDWSYEQIKTRILETVDLLPTLDGRTVTGGRINALAALQPAAGDFDDDGDIDGNDFLTWQRGESPIPLSPADLAEWEANFSATSSAIGPTANSGTVPEPATWVMLGVVMMGALVLRQ